MEALLRASTSRRSSNTVYQVFKRHFDLSSLPQPGPYVRMRLHPDWKQMDNRIRRMESRLADFRILSNDVRIQKIRLESGDSSMPTVRLQALIKEKESEAVEEKAAIIAELHKITASFVEGAQREHVALRKFFLLFLYHTTRLAFETLTDTEFEKLLIENPDGVSFEVPNKGTVSFPPHLCKKIAEGKRLFVTTTGVDTSPIAIALAIMQAPHQKHCTYQYCRREDCIAVKADYEELFEIFFKEKARALGFEKARGEMSAAFDVMLTLPSKQSEKEPEPEPMKQQASLRIS